MDSIDRSAGYYQNYRPELSVLSAIVIDAFAVKFESIDTISPIDAIAIDGN